MAASKFKSWLLQGEVYVGGKGGVLQSVLDLLQKLEQVALHIFESPHGIECTRLPPE
jgi:hypothetical protein